MGVCGISHKLKKKNNNKLIQTLGKSDIHNKQNEEEKIDKNKKELIVDEVDAGNGKKMSLKIMIKLSKSICKISYINNNKKYNGTGFFILLNNSFKCIMTNYHVIKKELINNNINIEIYNNNNNNNINFKLDNRNIKFYENLDITIIEIKESDEIIKDIKFLYYDLNYV